MLTGVFVALVIFIVWSCITILVSVTSGRTDFGYGMVLSNVFLAVTLTCLLLDYGII